MVNVKRISLALVLILIMNMCSGVSWAEAVPGAGVEGESRVEEILAGMNTEQKVAQMIMPSLRFWGVNDEHVTDLSAFPELAEILRRHQYGGVILFGSNVADTKQTVQLILDLQRNNAESLDALDTGTIPYLIAADQEGGSVARLTMGTRGTGSMAIGATGDEAESNAYAIGQVFGAELSALGINVNLGPCIDVITDLADLGMSTRVFSDDPETVAKLGLAFDKGVSESNVVTCFKHFPGAGDGSDYPTSIYLTPEQLKAQGLAAFTEAIDSGAEMVMVSATTFPLIDEEILMADGVTKGHYPATLSPVIVTDMLRGELGFDGVVMTDALEMEQFVTEPDNGMAYFPGDRGSAVHDIPVAEAAINAGCDILLIPTDLNGEKAADYYEEYIDGIVQLLDDGAISMERIDESVKRILTLKERRGVLDMDLSGEDLEERLETAVQTVGSPEHHEVEKSTAAKAVTLLKNDHVLPLSDELKRLVILCRTAPDNTPVTYALDLLKKDGFLTDNTRIENHISGEHTGDEDASRTIVIDRYYDTADGGQLVYTDELTSAIQGADAVICLSAVGAGLDSLQDDSPIMMGVSRALSEAHASGSKFILLSDNLPVDAARFQEADAIVCAYLSAGFKIDPTARTSGSENVGAFNANVPAALCAIFGDGEMEGSLPITIPALEKDADGKWVYSDTVLYERGYSEESPEEPLSVTLDVLNRGAEALYGCDVNITSGDFINLGFELGDACDVVLENDSYRYEFKSVPFYNGYYTKIGAPILCAYDYAVKEKRGKDYQYTRTDYPYLRFCFTNREMWNLLHLTTDMKCTITLLERGGYEYEQKLMGGLSYSKDFEDYEGKNGISKEEVFANFRAVRSDAIKENVLFRSASPFDNSNNRAPFVNALAKANGIDYVLNLADSQTKIDTYKETAVWPELDYSQRLLDNDQVCLMNMSAAYEGAAYHSALVKGLESALARNATKILIHCTEGKDRTGFVCLLLESLCGASYEEMLHDYMVTYDNYYNLTEESDKTAYDFIVELKFNDMLDYLLTFDATLEAKGDGTYDLDSVTAENYAAAARNFLLNAKMSEDNLQALTALLKK